MKVLHTADWHLGHIKTPTQHICNSIRKYLFPYIPKVDLITIGGDILDTSISMNSNNAYYVIQLIEDLVEVCYKSNTFLRILKGTHQHDKYQLESLSAIFDKYNNNSLIKYYNVMSYENIYDLNRTFYYLPDNLPYSSTDKIIKKMINDLSKNNVKQVDYLLCHGAFDFCNIPIKKNALLYNYYTMEKLVKKYILLGHIHLSFAYKKAVYSGSFDYLIHGDNSDKGFWIIDDETKQLKFILNEDTIPYKTIDLIKYNQDDKKIISTLDKYINKYFKLKELGYLRCLLYKTDNTPVLRKVIKTYIENNYKNIKVSFKIISNEDDNNDELILESNFNEELVKLNEETISLMVYENIKDEFPNLTINTIKNILNKQTIN